MRDIVDRCRVWESHADSDIRRAGKPGPDPTFPTYVVSGSDRAMDDLQVAAITNPQSMPDQLETMIWRLLAGTAVPAMMSRFWIWGTWQGRLYLSPTYC